MNGWEEKSKNFEKQSQENLKALKDINKALDKVWQAVTEYEQTKQRLGKVIHDI